MTTCCDDDTLPTADGPLVRALRAEALTSACVVAGWGAATSRGHVRARNEDAWGHLDNRVFIAADGMGGRPGGEVAAAVAVARLLEVLDEPLPASWDAALRQVNEQVRTAARALGYTKAGTALAAARVDAGVTTLVHVGDCRAYRRVGSDIVCLTRDHTIETELAAAGMDSAGRARQGLPLHALTRFIGGPNEACRPDVNALVPVAGDRICLMTDGVFRQLSPAAVAKLLSIDDPQQSADQIVEAANDAGGRDNVTVINIDFQEQP